MPSAGAVWPHGGRDEIARAELLTGELTQRRPQRVARGQILFPGR
jgi:hypothetical protein